MSQVEFKRFMNLFQTYEKLKRLVGKNGLADSTRRKPFSDIIRRKIKIYLAV